MTISSTFEGMDGLQDYFKVFPDRTKRALRLAINRTITREGMKLITEEMYDQVNFPRNYLKGNRLFVKQYAKESNLEGVILGRKRATSLARFASPGTPIGSRPGGSGVTVAVKRGSGVRMANAWLVRLRAGASLSEDQFNIGLAVRLKPGESLSGKYSTHKSWLIPGVVALLYGPSVNQVFDDVAESQGAEILDIAGTEFFRQFDRIK